MKKKKVAGSGKTTWGKGEIPYCEIESVEFPKKSGDPIVFHLTPRGAKESKRRDRLEERRAREARKRRNSDDVGLLTAWLFGPFRSDGKPVFS